MIQYSVTIPPRVVAGLRRHAAAAMPAECCGALIGHIAGTAMEVRTMIPLENTSGRTDRYVIDADVVLRLERQAACAGVQLVGFYHSHPAGPPEPSPTDLALASPGFLYVIVRPHDGSLRGWRLRDDRRGFMELPVSLLAGAA